MPKVFKRKNGIYVRGTPLERFMAHITIQENECWLWDVSNTDNGYVDFIVDGEKIKAHIWSYLHFIGGYDRSLDIDHTCHNDSGCAGGPTCLHRRCVNPYHLEPVTRKENANRGECGQYLAARTHCKSGHEFTPSNTQYGKRGNRRCKKCRALEHQKFKTKNPEAYKKRYTKGNLKFRHGISQN